MSKNEIPTFLITDFNDSPGSPNYVIIEKGEETPALRANLPYRSDYYALGVCLRGEISLSVNLRTYHIGPGAVAALTPEQIKRWYNKSSDHLGMAVLFKKEYLLANSADPNLLDSFPFFHFETPSLCFLSLQNAELLGDCIKNIKKSAQSDHSYKDDIIRNLLYVLLYNAAGMYEKACAQATYHHTRQEVIFSRFQHLVSTHIKTERTVLFYASELHVTPKHLSETIKEVSGKTAQQWISEAIILEAKVLLQDIQLTISQVAESLTFSDPSTFGKFFKGQTGASPSAFRDSF